VFDELPKYQTDSSEFFFDGLGGRSLSLPSGWVPGNNPTQMTMLDADLRKYDIDLKRRILGGGGSLVLPHNLDFDANYTHETKTGEKLVGAVLGINGGNPRAVIVPEPLDYTTQQIDSHLRYTTDLLQLQLGYYASGFDNDDDWLRWENPYLPASNWPDRGPVGYPAGQKGEMPDNWFHQVSGSGGLNLPYHRRLTVNTAFGWMTQHDDFQPYTINPNIATPLGLPGNDLDGMVKTRLVSAQFLSNPIPKLGFKAAYRWNERDNDTSVEDYYRVPNDVGDQVAEEDARLNRPYSFEHHQVDVSLSYDVWKRTKLTALYAWDRTERDLQEVERNDENSFGFQLVSRANRYVTGGARYERFYRTGSRYDCVRPATATEANPLPNLGCPSESGSGLVYENHPLIRKYYMADRHRNEVHGWITVMPIESLSIGFDTRYDDDDYYHSTYGLTDSKSVVPGVDLTWTPADWLSFHAFYNFQKIEAHQNSISWSDDTTAFDTDRRWTSRSRDIFHTVGAGFDVDAIPDRLTIGVDYLFAKSRGKIDTDVGSALTPMLPFPDNNTRLHDIRVHGDVRITEHLSTRLGYLFEKYHSSDWAIDSVCPGCMNFSGTAAAIGAGEQSPDYHAHVVSWSMKWEFW
jgi:MtrB/PioB family decaheme-associated outer membrane protein